MPDVVVGVVVAQQAVLVQLPAGRRGEVDVLLPVGVEHEGGGGHHHPECEEGPGGGGGSGGSPGAGSGPLPAQQLHGEVEEAIYEPAAGEGGGPHVDHHEEEDVGGGVGEAEGRVGSPRVDGDQRDQCKHVPEVVGGGEEDEGEACAAVGPPASPPGATALQ